MAGERHIMSIFITENKTSIYVAHILSLRTAIERERVECALISQNYRLFSKVRIRTFLFRFFFFYYFYSLTENNTYFFIKSNIFLLFWQQGFFTFFPNMSNGCKLNCGVDMVDIMHYNSRTAIGLRYYSSFFSGGFFFYILRLFKGSILCWILWCPCWHIKVFLSFSTRKNSPVEACFGDGERKGIHLTCGHIRTLKVRKIAQ